MSENRRYEVAIIGGGVAGLSAGIFTAGHDFKTIILSSGSSLLRRNAHLDNYPGFPAGVNSRLLLDMMVDQAERRGCEFEQAHVSNVDHENNGFSIETEEKGQWYSDYIIAATKNTTAYLERLDGVEIVDQGKKFVQSDDRGRTGVDGLYVAGRMARKPHQTIVSAGHGAEVAVTLLEDDDRPFYHDWVAPKNYFTGRGREVPPGCEEIDEDERRNREKESLEVMSEYFSKPHPDSPEQHPSVEKDE